MILDVAVSVGGMGVIAKDARVGSARVAVDKRDVKRLIGIVLAARIFLAARMDFIVNERSMRLAGILVLDERKGNVVPRPRAEIHIAHVLHDAVSIEPGVGGGARDRGFMSAEGLRGRTVERDAFKLAQVARKFHAAILLRRAAIVVNKAETAAKALRHVEQQHVLTVHLLLTEHNRRGIANRLRRDGALPVYREVYLHGHGGHPRLVGVGLAAQPQRAAVGCRILGHFKSFVLAARAKSGEHCHRERLCEAEVLDEHFLFHFCLDFWN